MDESDGKPVIRLEKDGPLIVKGLPNFSNSRGEPIKTRPTLRLCRCGNSKNKPLCDGTHARVGWSDEKSSERVEDRIDLYQGDGLAIHDNRGICAHSGFCTAGLPVVWRSIEPWIDASAAPSEAIVNTIRMCPSGALSYEQNHHVETEYSDQTGIRITRNGPYRVAGGIELEDVEFGQGASLDHFTLCRCGHSRNKPFCDGSHWYAGFKDDEAMTISKANRGSAEAEEQWVPVGAASDFEPDAAYSAQVGRPDRRRNRHRRRCARASKAAARTRAGRSPRAPSATGRCAARGTASTSSRHRTERSDDLSAETVKIRESGRDGRGRWPPNPSGPPGR